MNSFDSFFDTLSDDPSTPSEPFEQAPAAWDWDESVRAAFARDCMNEGIRAGVLLEALRHARHPEMRRVLGVNLNRAAHRASEGWAAIDRCLDEWGEMSACALERAVEEAALELRREGKGAVRDRFARAIVERARARLARFRSRTAFAA
jgi:hypothetical protein